MKAVIAGAGIGGLTAALCLDQIGWDVELLERAGTVEEAGAGIQISPNGMKVMQALGLGEQIAAAGFRPRASQIRRGKSGRVLMVSPMGPDMERRYGVPYVHIHRADLVDILMGALAERVPGAVNTGCRVTGFDQDGDQALARLETGEAIYGDVLIGADGIRSAIRDQMLGPERPRFTGNVAWRAVVPTKRLGRNVPPPAASVWTGDGKHAVTYLLHGGELANFVGVVECESWTKESWTEPGAADEVLADFADWHPIIRTLIEQADIHHRWALFDRDPLEKWSDGRVVLLGDAAHPMLPFMAQGAVQAIEDAFVLAREIQGSTDVVAACATFFRKRIGRVTRVQAAARANMDLFHQRLPQSPLWLADKVAPSAVERQLDWLYGYDVIKG
ncbi:MAG: FAD-dependent monooxygenase [Pseudomonadota bacterium]